MKTLSLGHTGVEVSALCLGTMRFGWRTPADVSYQLLDQYFEAGGRFLDTANIYGRQGGQRVGETSERLLGQWIKERRNRADLFLATKVGFPYADVERGLSAAQIKAECEKSLNRLGVETIDLFYAHVDDRHTPIEETMEAFNHLVQAGKVRYIGASNFLTWRLERANCISQHNGWVTYCCIQQRHTYLRPKHGASFGNQIVATSELLDYCQATGTRLLAYSPLLSGSYTREDRPIPDQYIDSATKTRLSTLNNIAKEIKATPNQVILAWMLQSQPAIIPVFSGSKPEQIQENLGSLDVELSPDQIQQLSETYS